MIIEIEDFNHAEAVLSTELAAEWNGLEATLSSMPVHLKASDQAGKQGSLIFDPVGTNSFIKEGLCSRGWAPNVPMPEEFKFLGLDVDFMRSGLLLEVQFSNYPFLLNNTLRAELLYKSKVPMDGSPVSCMVVITKAHMFPASNSTLYFEQAVNQLRALATNSVFDVPIRLVGLFAPSGDINAVFTRYHNPRYSRTVLERTERAVQVRQGRNGANARRSIRVAQD